MFAVIIYNRALIFDATRHYGFFELKDLNLEGYLTILDYKKVLYHYECNYFKQNINLIERYSDFIFEICLNYLKDFQYI